MVGSWRPLNSEVHGLVPTAEQSAPFFVFQAFAVSGLLSAFAV